MIVIAAACPTIHDLPGSLRREVGDEPLDAAVLVDGGEILRRINAQRRTPRRRKPEQGAVVAPDIDDQITGMERRTAGTRSPPVRRSAVSRSPTPRTRTGNPRTSLAGNDVDQLHVPAGVAEPDPNGYRASGLSSSSCVTNLLASAIVPSSRNCSTDRAPHSSTRARSEGVSSHLWPCQSPPRRCVARVIRVAATSRKEYPA